MDNVVVADCILHENQCHKLTNSRARRCGSSGKIIIYQINTLFLCDMMRFKLIRFRSEEKKSDLELENWRRS